MIPLKPVSVAVNCVGLRTTTASHVGAAVLAHVAAKVVREPRLLFVTERGLNPKLRLTFKLCIDFLRHL